MAQLIRPVGVPAGRGSRTALVLAVLALVAAAVLLPILRPRAAGRVVRHAATEMPNLDTGVRQAVHVTFAGDPRPRIGRPAELRFVVTSGVADAEVQARLAAPQGATISAGRSDWSGQLGYGQVAEIPVSVTFSGDKGGFVRGEVITRLPDGQVFRNATAVYVDPGDPDTRTPQPRTLIEPDGSRLDVLVYRDR